MKFSTQSNHIEETPNLEKGGTFEVIIAHLPQKILSTSYPKFMEGALQGTIDEKKQGNKKNPLFFF